MLFSNRILLLKLNDVSTCIVCTVLYWFFFLYYISFTLELQVTHFFFNYTLLFMSILRHFLIDLYCFEHLFWHFDYMIKIKLIIVSTRFNKNNEIKRTRMSLLVEIQKLNEENLFKQRKMFVYNLFIKLFSTIGNNDTCMQFSYIRWLV